MLQLIAKLPTQWQLAVTGALLGDALGVPHEFKAGTDVPSYGEIQMVMPPGYRKTYETIPYGTGSDDSAQLLALLDTLVANQGGYAEQLFLSNLLAWLHEAKYQAGGVVFDVGGQTLLALRSREQGLALPELPRTRCGNGSLMRVLPVAALPDMFGISRDTAVQVAMAQSDVTHPHPLARVCCALYVELCWLVQAGRTDFVLALQDAGRVLLARKVLSPEEEDSLMVILAYGASNMPTGSGYVVNTLWTALSVLARSTNLSQALRLAVGVGNDTDTVACVTGGLAALAFGLDDQTSYWLRQLVMPELE